MTEIINTIMNWINQYYGNAIFLVMAIFAYVYLFVKDKDSRVRVIYPVLLIVFVVVNPILYKYIFSKIVYWRLLWMLPISIMIAFAVTRTVRDSKVIISKVVLMGMLVVCIVLIGTNVFQNGGFIKTQNSYKISQDVVEVCDAIFELDENPRCIMPATLYSEVRQYASEFKMLYGRDVEGFIIWESSNTYQNMFNAIESKEVDYETILQDALIESCSVIVVSSAQPVDKVLQERYGYIDVGYTKSYCIYYNKHIKNKSRSGWIVTQYNSNGNLYTIEDKERNLIIIDGGNEKNEELLRDIIQEHGNCVTAWIITHPHKDQVGAFNKILENPQDIVVQKLYSIEVDYNRYIETECSQEEIMHYITFLKRIQQIGDKHSVYENDTISILGLKIEILNAWSDTTNEHNKNLCDYAAMCILITGNEEKFLFCSDIPKGERESIFETYKCEMDNIDYMQSSDCFSYQELLEINRLIKPKIFFYDEMADYKDKLLKCDMVLYDYGNDYNSIVLK